MNVAFVTYVNFQSNSGVHVFNLANALVDLGYNCVVCVPNDPDTVGTLGQARFHVVDHDQATRALRFPDGTGAQLVHAWTPREVVRDTVERLVARHGCPYVVHLEDNEDVVTSLLSGIEIKTLRRLPDERLRLDRSLAHPVRWREFVAGAAGITVIIDRLLDFRPNGAPAEVIWPAYEPELFRPLAADSRLRESHGIGPREKLVVYPGNAHPANATELRSLYLAVALLNRNGRPVRLVRLGDDYVDVLGADRSLVEQFITKVGHVARYEIPRYLGLADVLVQPGGPGDFNDYRFPSKLPEFLAMGKPVVLPRANIGRYLDDGENCLLLDQGHSLEIAEKIERLLDDPRLAERIATGARRFAEANFSWSASASRLAALYDRVVGHRRGHADALRQRYTHYRPPRVGYATVRDFCDSVEHLPELATANRDMKDVQRPWIVKAVIGCAAPGARLLEIGAGDPLVADLLDRLGYQVTVVDPYDGRDGGPSDVERIRAAYPRVRILQGLFPEVVEAEQPFDLVYSISVLEHIPNHAVADICSGLLRLTRPGGYTTHAVDHVHLGDDDAEHLDRLRSIVAGLGIGAAEFNAVLDHLERDPETYFLSAAAHNRWRGNTPYDAFSMRRCVSINLAVSV